MKKVKFYYVVYKEEDKETILTLVNSKKNAWEYTMNYLRLHHAKHFEAWCQARNLDPTSLDVFVIYSQNCIDLEILNAFRLKKVYFKANDLAEGMRVLCGFSPLGLSYEGPLETSLLLESMQNSRDEETKDILETQKRLNPFLKTLSEEVENCGE